MRERSQYEAMLNGGEEGTRRACEELRELASGGRTPPNWVLDLLRKHCSERSEDAALRSDYLQVRDVTDPLLVALLVKDSSRALTAGDVRTLIGLLESANSFAAGDLTVRRGLDAALRAINGRVCLVFDPAFQRLFVDLWQAHFRRGTPTPPTPTRPPRAG
jgi:hypothetical protein